MLRSMYSAVSGLRSHQSMMDVTGNNISNVNTTGFKSSRTTFQEALSQVVRGGAEGVQDGQGGINAQQIGLGTQVSATDQVFSQGASQTTGRALDVAIQGEGFFVLRPGEGGDDLYTRSGAFTLDNEGQLVGSGGEVVQGEDLLGGGAVDDVRIDTDLYTDIAIGPDGTVTGRDALGEEVDLYQMAMARFPNAGGLERIGNGFFAATGASGGAIDGFAGEDGIGTLQSGTLEMSNVDLAQEFTNLIMSQRGFQANARTITTSDELLQELMNIKR